MPGTYHTLQHAWFKVYVQACLPGTYHTLQHACHVGYDAWTMCTHDMMCDVRCVMYDVWSRNCRLFLPSFLGEDDVCLFPVLARLCAFLEKLGEKNNSLLIYVVFAVHATYMP